MNRILALDYGAKKIGVAISDPLRIIAKPITVIYNTGFKNVLKDLNSLVDEYNISELLIGLPITLKNTRSIQTDKVLEFIDMLKENINLPIHLYDERLTSQMATRSLIMQGVKTGHNKAEIDKTAAAIFLQNYLDDSKK